MDDDVKDALLRQVALNRQFVMSYMRLYGLEEEDVLQMNKHKLSPEEHKARHVELHRALDELAADWMRHTGKRASSATILELMEWSHEQTENPTEV